MTPATPRGSEPMGSPPWFRMRNTQWNFATAGVEQEGGQVLSSLSGLGGLRTELLGLSFPFSSCVSVHHSQAVEKGVGSLRDMASEKTSWAGQWAHQDVRTQGPRDPVLS